MYCIFDEMFTLLRELGFEDVHSLDLNLPVHIGDFEIIPRRALDADVDSLFQIKAAGMNVLNVVDSWIDEPTLDLLVRQGPWDLVLWPFQTMREIEALSPSVAEPASRALPSEWIEQLQALKPRFVVPSSCQFHFEEWSWLNRAFFPITYAQFARELAKSLPAAQVIRLNPGVSVELSASGVVSAGALSWIQPIGDQNLDYEYDENVKPQSTSEIARHFEPLTTEQAARVLNYCRTELLERFTALESFEDSYFAGSRAWRLSIFDHQGLEYRFNYRLQETHITLVEEDTMADCLTEIPMARLYGAIENGESLTSLYLRVDAGDADVTEDPLLRTLYNSAFAAYQVAQLKRIKKTSAAY